MDELRRGGEVCAVGFVPTERILLPPVDREGMRRKAGSAVECAAGANAARKAKSNGLILLSILEFRSFLRVKRI